MFVHMISFEIKYDCSELQLPYKSRWFRPAFQSVSNWFGFIIIPINRGRLGGNDRIFFNVTFRHKYYTVDSRRAVGLTLLTLVVREAVASGQRKCLQLGSILNWTAKAVQQPLIMCKLGISLCGKDKSAFHTTNMIHHVKNKPCTVHCRNSH